MNTVQKFAPNEQRRIDVKKLREFVATLGDGQRVSWVEVTQRTGITMNDRGKDLVRLALRQERRPYEPIPGAGFEMSSSENGLTIVNAKTRRFVSALDVARETTEQVAGRHIDAMTSDKRSQLIQRQAVFSTLALSATLARKSLPEKT